MHYLNKRNWAKSYTANYITSNQLHSVECPPNTIAFHSMWKAVEWNAKHQLHTLPIARYKKSHILDNPDMKLEKQNIEKQKFKMDD